MLQTDLANPRLIFNLINVGQSINICKTMGQLIQIYIIPKYRDPCHTACNLYNTVIHV